LPETKLPGHYHRLIRFITGFDDPVGGTHANWEEARTDHDGVQVPSAGVIGKTVQPEGNWILKIFRFSVRKEQGIVQALEEGSEPL
jgi:hypothetical protein